MTDHPDVAVRPPILFLLGLALGALLEIVFPLGPGLAGGGFRPVVVGLVMALAGTGLAANAIGRFHRAGTNVPTVEPAVRLVTDGPYRLTRNPIYIGLTLIYFGLAVALTTLWGLALLPAVLVVLDRGVVKREEAYLARRFPDAYRGYMERVPRWL